MHFRLGPSLLLVLLLLAPGCKRPAQPSQSGTATNDANYNAVEFQAMAQLPPNRTVHVAVDSLGNIFDSVETSDGTDGMVVLSEGGIPRATQLTSARILSVMGELPGGSGTIQELVGGADGVIWFYFVGGRGRSARACVGQYSLRDELIKIVYDKHVLAEVSGMGDSIALARGSLVRAGGWMYLMLRHIDRAIVFRFPDAAVTTATLPAPKRVLEGLNFQGSPIDLTPAKYELSAGFDQDLLLIDHQTGQIFRVDPASGAATPYLSLTGLPKEFSAPLALTNPNRLLLFAADSELIEPSADDALSLSRRIPKVTYPAVIEAIDNEFKLIGREHLHAPTGFPVYAMRIHQIIRMKDGSFLAYEATSGQIMRLRLVEMK